MFANRYTALVDACTLVSAPRRDLLLTLAEAEFFRPGVLAVGVENHALNPGETTRVFVIRQREGDE